MADIQIKVNGRFQHLESVPADVQMSTVWPGGSDELSWTPGEVAGVHRFRGGTLVDGFHGPVARWAGGLQEPDPAQDQLTAIGAWREAEDYYAVGPAGGAALNPDVAVDQAIIRGLNWTRPTSLTAVATVTLDISQGPVKLAALLDAWTEQTGQRWGVDAQRRLIFKADDTTPTYQTFPLQDGLGYALDNFASSLMGRYLDSATSTFKTTIVTDATADANHTHSEDIVDLTVKGAITTAAANNILTNLLKLGRAIPQWSDGIEFAYGEILTMGGTAVALETVTAGTLLRIHGGWDLAQRLNGQLYYDVPIGRTTLSGGTLTIQPANVAVGTLPDAIAAALST